MLRDKIKNEKYFEEYLKVCDENIKEFVCQLSELDSENTFGKYACKLFISDYYYNKIVSMYSSSYKIEDIKKEFCKYMDYFIESVDENSGYYRVVDTLALAVLLRYDNVVWLKQILDKSGLNDCLLTTLVNWLGAGLPDTNEDCFCTWFIRFLEVAPEERASFLKDYLKNEWYRSHKDAAWYDSHKSKVNIYAGYWSFEVGAIAKIFDISDDITWPYYPYDLVHTN